MSDVFIYASACELVMVGPTMIDVQSAGSVLVHHSDVVVRATDGAEGFVVTTPTSEVIDLGTDHFEIVHGGMNVKWPVPGGRLGSLNLPGGGVYCVRPMAKPIRLDRDGITHTSPLVLPPEQTTLWIGKIVSRAKGEDKIFFRVYGEKDVLDYAEPATWHVVARGVDHDASLDLVLLGCEGKTARLIDKLRIGPTWRSVAPLKETKE